MKVLSRNFGAVLLKKPKKVRDSVPLNGAAYVEDVKEKILIWREEAKEISDKRVIWDWIKYNVRLFSIDYSKRRAKANREEEEMMHKLNLNKIHV